MNASTILSFAVGAMILLAVFTLNSRMVQNSSDVTMDQMVKQKLGDVVNVVSSDFRKIGYNVKNGAIVSAGSHQIEFKSDINNNGSVDLIDWQYDTSKPDLNTKNPNDYALIRTVNGNSSEIDMGVTRFNIVLMDSLGQVTNTLSNVREIEVKILCQGAEKVDNKYNEAAWQKTFMPWNLK
ncbi:MAG TPA: hypothetical protein VKA34_08830 [Balneolales bacterium]|nr:hypothetical protein [Balneolales bacterium]